MGGHHQGWGFNGVIVVNQEVSEMRKLIAEVLDAYQAKCGGGVKVRWRLLALLSFLDMHSDICICVENVMAVLVLLHFHKAQWLDGSMDAGCFGRVSSGRRPWQCHQQCERPRGLGAGGAGARASARMSTRGGTGGRRRPPTS